MTTLRNLAMSALVLVTSAAVARADGPNPVRDTDTSVRAATAASPPARFASTVRATRNSYASAPEVTGSLSRRDLSTGAVDHREWLLQNSAR